LRRGARVAAALALAALAAVLLSACATTQEKSARLEKIALKKAANLPLGAKGLKIAKPSAEFQVLDAVALHSSEGTAVALKLRNRSGKAQSVVPVLITVTGANGASVYSNSTPGLANSLVSASYVPAHGTVVWVNDQIQATATAQGVKTEVGEGKPASGSAPAVKVTEYHLEHEPGGIALVAGKVSNPSKVAQRELVVTAVAERGGKTVAAGRSVVPELAAGGTGSFQIFLVGSDSGAKITVGVTPSTLG
jgi:hypothetical protein